jgi:hypothetical protein
MTGGQGPAPARKTTPHKAIVTWILESFVFEAGKEALHGQNLDAVLQQSELHSTRAFIEYSVKAVHRL